MLSFTEVYRRCIQRHTTTTTSRLFAIEGGAGSTCTREGWQLRLVAECLGRRQSYVVRYGLPFHRTRGFPEVLRVCQLRTRIVVACVECEHCSADVAGTLLGTPPAV